MDSAAFILLLQKILSVIIWFQSQQIKGWLDVDLELTDFFKICEKEPVYPDNAIILKIDYEPLLTVMFEWVTENCRRDIDKKGERH